MGDAMILLVERLLPIIIMIGIGIFARRIKLFDTVLIEGLKTIIVKIALPAVLFGAFATVHLEISYIWIFVLVFLLCCLLYGMGELLHKKTPSLFPERFTSGFFTGFEFGMIGVGLFSAIWGVEHLATIMLIGFGHELFIWFVYVPLLENKDRHTFQFKKTLVAFLKTPTIIAIFLGIVFNLSGMYIPFGLTAFGAGVYATLAMITPLTSPLILIVIGYSMTFEKSGAAKVLAYVGGRALIVGILGVSTMFLAIKMSGISDPMFALSFVAFLLLPPPYILPLYIREQKEAEFFSQMLVYSTVVSFVGYILVMTFCSL